MSMKLALLQKYEFVIEWSFLVIPVLQIEIALLRPSFHFKSFIVLTANPELELAQKLKWGNFYLSFQDPDFWHIC